MVDGESPSESWENHTELALEVIGRYWETWRSGTANMRSGSGSTCREVFDGQLSYWREQLDGIGGVPGLPVDRVREAVLGHSGGRYEWSFRWMW